MTDTVLENTLTDVRKHWRRRELKSLCLLQNYCGWICHCLGSFKAHIEGKKGFSGGAQVLSWALRTPTHPPAGAGVALSLPFLRGLHQVPGRLWRGGAHNSAQFPFLSILGEKGQCRIWKGKSRALHSQSLGSPPATSGHRSPWGHTQIGTKRNYLAFLGLQFSSLWDIPLLWKGNAKKSNSREEWAVFDSLLKRKSLQLHWHFISYGIWSYQSMIKYHTEPL